MTERPATPMLERRSAIRDQAQVIGQFLDWLRTESGLDLAEPVTEIDADGDEVTRYWWLSMRSTVEILDEYFAIDQQQVDREQEALLAWVRAEQGMTPEGGRA